MSMNTMDTDTVSRSHIYLKKIIYNVLLSNRRNVSKFQQSHKYICARLVNAKILIDGEFE